MALIRANRESIDDRFSVLGFTVRTKDPLYAIGLAIHPDLLRSENRSRRTASNFFASPLLAAGGSTRGEATYLVPPNVVARFVGQPRLYFGLVTYRDDDRSTPVSVNIPDRGNMYVSLSGLSERGLRRTARVDGATAYGGNGAKLTWGGDILVGAGNGAAGAAGANGSAGSNPSAAGSPTSAQPYSDGYSDNLWNAGSSAAAPVNGSAASATAPTPAHEGGAGGAAATPSPAGPVPVSAQAFNGYGANRAQQPARHPALAKPLLVEPYYRPSNWFDALTTQIGFFLESAMWYLGVSDTTVPPHSAICQVRRPDGSAEGALHGSAFYIAPNLLLTAAHVVDGQSELIIVRGKNGGGVSGSTEPFGRFRVRAADFRKHPSYVAGNQDFDMALIRVPAANAAPAGGYFDLVEELTQSRPEGVVVAGYAARWYASDAMERFVNDTIDPNKQHMMGGYIRSLPSDETFDYDLQTLGGTSGSPVYWLEGGSSPRAHMVGVHVAAHSASTNLGCRITSAKLDWIRTTASGWGLTLSFSLGSARGRVGARSLTASEAVDEDSQHGIEGPIPDDLATAQALARTTRALSMPAPEYPQANRFVAANSGNFRASTGNRSIERIVIHITDGGANINGTIGWFQNPSAKVSAHYVIGQDGEIVQMVRHNDVAWHARSANGTSIGIEHVANTRGLNPTPAQMCASAALVSWLCDQYGIAVDRTHILGHSEADTATSHSGCPNAVWDWNYYMGMITSRTCYEPDSTTTTTPTAQGLAARSGAYSRAQEIITPFYDPADPASALQSQADAFSQAREEWFAGVPNTRIFPHSAICLLEMKNAAGNVISRGTGFYIGTNRVLTCAHNLAGADTASVDIVPGKNGQGSNTEPFGRANMPRSAWRIPSSYSSPNSGSDLAVIDNVSLAAPAGRWFDVLEELRESRPEGVVVCGYSSRSVRVPELTAAIDGYRQHLHAGYIAALGPDNSTFDYPILTLKRASGSPVYYLSDRDGLMQAYVVGVHTGSVGDADDVNRGCRLTENKIAWIQGTSASLALSQSTRIRELGRTANNPAARGLAIPLDPGIGGQSIGTDALAVGDIIVSTARAAVSYLIRAGTVSAISHAMIYVGDGRVVEAVGEGVREVPLATAIGDAILAVAYRDPRVDSAQAAAIAAFARSQVGQPYNYAGVARVGWRILHPLQARIFDAIRERLGTDNNSAQSFYCSELVFSAYENAGAPLVAARADSSSPEDLLRLTHGSLDYVGHLVASDELLGIALSLGASTTPDFAVHLIPQPDKNACWAASMAMLLSYRRNASYSPETLANEVGQSLATSYGWDLLTAVRDRYGFTLIEQPSNTSIYHSPQQWSDWLGQYGPLWVVIVGAPHAVVLAGIRGNLADPAAVQVKLLNPWDTRVTFDNDPIIFHPANNGYEDWIGFEQFASDFGNMAEADYGNWRVLYLPESAATSQALGASRGGRLRLAQPPAPIRALEAGPEQTSEPIEPSRIVGTRMSVLRGRGGSSRWALDQLQGMKAPASTSSSDTLTAPSDVRIELGEWPAIEGQPSPLPLSVNFRAAQGSVGDISITVGTPPELGYGVDVSARIDNAEDVGANAVLKVGINYRFNGLAAGSPAAHIELRLLGDGRYERVNNWVSSAAAA